MTAPLDATIRTYAPHDEEQVVELSLRAWEPVFASMRTILGSDLDRALHGDDWKSHQAASVRATVTAPGTMGWVAEWEGQVVAFVVVVLRDEARKFGEIEMLAVDPSHKGRGLGTRLTQLATEWLRERGVKVAMVDTGGDPGHAPARRTYEKAGYTLMPLARYFKAL